MIKTIKILTLAVIVSAIGFSSCSKEKTYSSADEMINAMKAKVESLNVEELNTKLEKFVLRSFFYNIFKYLFFVLI